MKDLPGLLVHRLIRAVIPLILVWHALLFYGFLGKIPFYAILAAALILFLIVDWRNALLLSCSLLGATLLMNLLLGLAGVENRIYYRDHERYVMYNSDFQGETYRKNVDVVIAQPFGDVYAVGGAKGLVPEPRNVRFRTDSLGFRNSTPYHGQKYVLVGDSFVMCMGTSQEEMLASRLMGDYGIDAYGLAFPGGIPQYVRLIRYLEKKHGGNFRVLLFLFEGNDFPTAFSRTEMKMKKGFFEGLAASYRSFFAETTLYRYTFSLAAARSKKARLTSTVFEAKGLRIGDFDEYIDSVKRTEYRLPPQAFSLLDQVKERIAGIYFIPEKYRVYRSLIDPSGKDRLPNAQWEAVKSLSARLGVPCTDLTGALIEESARLLDKGELTFWRDDSHWNGRGIAVAARIVAAGIAGHQSPVAGGR